MYILIDWVGSFFFNIFLEEAAADEKKGKLYKPKSRFDAQTKSILPLETPPQFLAFDRKQVGFTKVSHVRF